MAVKYRDPTPFKSSDRANINLLANAIRTKMYGEDVREAIASTLEKLSSDKANYVSTPKGAYPTLNALQSEYPDGNTGIYITSNNGHWWIYNYEQKKWADGGIYQSMELANRSVDTDALSNNIKNNLLNMTGGKVLLSWKAGYIASHTKEVADGTKEGTLVSNASFSVTQKIIVHSGDLLIVDGYASTTMVLVALYDMNGEYVQSLKDGISGTDKAIVTVPQHGYVIVSNYNQRLDPANVSVELRPLTSAFSLNNQTASAISWDNVPLAWSPKSYIGSDENVSNNKNKIANSGAIGDNYLLSKTFGVKAGTLVTINGGIAKTAWLLAETDSTGTQFKSGVIKGEGASTTYTRYFDHSAYLRVSNNTILQANPTVSTKITSSNLAGKTINVIGDSYVENNNDIKENTWHYKLAQKYGMTYRNYGHNGNGLIDPNRNGVPVVERFNDMENGADYVVVIGGKNDYNGQFPLADFKNGIATIIKGLVVKYPDAKLCFFTPWSLGDNEKQDIKLIDYAQAIEDTCNMFGVACFNSYKKSNITPWDANFRKKYMQADNDISHLNSAGHDRFMPRAEAFLNGL